MTNNEYTQFVQDIFQPQFQQPDGVTTVRGVRQDNPTPPHARIASPQPAPRKNMMRPHQMNRNHSRSQKRSTPNRQTIHTTLHLKPRVRAELERIAGLRNLSISATGAALVEWALQQDLETQHGVLLEAIIDKAIGKHMRTYSNRLAVLLVRSLFASEQTRSFAVNILGRQPGMTDTELTEIKNGANTTARSNITRITPQLKTLIEAVQKQLTEEVNASG